MPDERPRLLTISQAAARLGISQDTLRRWADDGRVKAVRLPSGYRRFDPAEVERAERELLGREPGAGAEVYGGYSLVWKGGMTVDGRFGRCWVNAYANPEDAERTTPRVFAFDLVVSRYAGDKDRSETEAVDLAVELARRQVHDRIDRDAFERDTLYRLRIGRDWSIVESVEEELTDWTYE